MRLLFAAAVIAACLVHPSFGAPEEKPAVEIKTRSIEASVTVDAKLKAYPTLYTKLVTAGEKEMAKRRSEADGVYKTDPNLFNDGRRYGFERSYEQRSVILHYVSIVRRDSYYTMGAHPNPIVDTLLWDTAAQKFISIRPFFTETADGGPAMQTLAKAVRAAIITEKKRRDIPPEVINDPTWFAHAINPTLLDIGGIALAPSSEHGKSAGLLFYFSPYAVGSYAEGFYTVFVPWSTFKAYLSPEGEAMFGGERPKGDSANDGNS